MKYPLFPILPLLASASLMTIALDLHAEIQVNDNVVSGSLDPEGKQNDEALMKWPEEVQFSCPLVGPAQIAGTVIANNSQFSSDSDVPIFSRVVGQIFPGPEDADQTLEKIFILGNSVLQGNTPMKLRPRLVDLGTSPSLDEYDAGTNLFAGDPVIEITTPSEKASAQIVEFTFTGNDRIRLKKGHTYAFELVGDEENKKASAFTWFRSGGRPTQTPAFYVGHKDSTTSNDQREAIKDRQTFMGVKTSPAN